jgi:tryptophan synthase alpha chain
MNAKRTSMKPDQAGGEHNIRSAFIGAREEGRGSLVGYLMAGDPSPRDTPKLCQALIRGGVDVLELGIPFSDPIADGPTIQAAGVRSINAGTTPEDCFDIVRQVKKDSERSVPIVFLAYYNTLFHFGLDKFLSRCRSSGVDGIIVPDLPQIGSSELGRYLAAVKQNHLASILLATLTTSDERLSSIVSNSTGFLYLVSLLGVTGVRKGAKKLELNAEFIQHVCEIAHNHSSRSTPVAVGFGISEPVDVQNVLRAGADGAIVGSALVNIISQNLFDLEKAAMQLEQHVSSLKKATFLISKKFEKEKQNSRD